MQLVTMPLVRIISSVEPPPTADSLLRDLSALLARELGKPESYVMTCLEPRASMTFGGSFEPSCYVEVKNVGTFTPAQTVLLSAALSERLAAGLGVPRNRIYIEFADAPPHMWGYDGDTFA
jgi:phenylpyruvate tautomerase PptA (4-oxalocrotonate tautomerase family)